MQRFFALTILLLAACRIAAHGQGPFPLPEPTGSVNDFAHVLDAETVSRLQALSTELDAKTHAEITVVIVDSIGDFPINDYAMELFNHWGIGHDDSRGILIFLAVSDHKWRIETGNGFKILFPNERVAKIGATMVPSLRRALYSDAVWAAPAELARIVARDRRASLTSLVAAQPRSLPGAPISVAKRR